MAVGLLVVGALLALLLVPVGLLVFALVDLLRRPDPEWAWSGQDRLTWVLVVLFVGLLGPILYLVVARPRLDQARYRLALAAGWPAPVAGPAAP